MNISKLVTKVIKTNHKRRGHNTKIVWLLSMVVMLGHSGNKSIQPII